MVWLSAVLRNIRSARSSTCIRGGPRSCSTSENNVLGFYSPFHLTAPFRNTSLKVSTLPNSQRYRLLIGSGPACLWENCLICAHSSPGNSLECALWVSSTGFFFSFSSTRCLHSRAPGKVPLQKGGGGTQVDGPYYANLKLFHFLQLTHRVLLFCLMALQNINFIFIFPHRLHIWRLFSAVQHTTSTYVKWCLERNNGGTSGNSSACDAS